MTQSEFAFFANVSRVTVNNWVHGRLGVHDARITKISRLLHAIELAVVAKAFPLAAMPKDKRIGAIRDTLLVYLAAK
jgi:transcriptional regulator with XRE-family HTH domain